VKNGVIYLWVFFLVTGLAGCKNNTSKAPDKDGFAFKEIYDARADSEADIAAAIARAGVQQKRILLVFGGNWCPWCQRLHHLFENDEEIKRFLAAHYELVMIDLGRRDHNLAIDAKYGHPNKLGLPALVVLESDGTPLCSQETGALEFPKEHPLKGHDPEKVLTFLETWARPKA